MQALMSVQNLQAVPHIVNQRFLFQSKRYIGRVFLLLNLYLHEKHEDFLKFLFGKSGVLMIR